LADEDARYRTGHVLKLQRQQRAKERSNASEGAVLPCIRIVRRDFIRLSRRVGRAQGGCAGHGLPDPAATRSLCTTQSDVVQRLRDFGE
jgi:hypothetical protein